MNADPADNSDGNNRRYRFRFSLLSLMFITTVACVGIAWTVSHRKSEIMALLQVSSSSTSFDTLQSTHLSLLQSTALIQAVVTDPNISKLRLIKDQADPANWLTQSLAVALCKNRKSWR
jgi:hypothetical protein